MYQIKVKIADDYAVAMVILIGVEFVSSFALSICEFVSLNAGREDTAPEGIASLVIFCLFGALFVVATVLLIVCNVVLKENWGVAEVLVFIAVPIFGGLFYFIGDNLSPIFQQYGGQLHCDPDCISRITSFGTVCTGMSAALNFLTATVIDVESEGLGKTWPYSVKVMKFFGLMTIFDLLFTSTGSSEITTLPLSTVATQSAAFSSVVTEDPLTNSSTVFSCSSEAYYTEGSGFLLGVYVLLFLAVVLFSVIATERDDSKCKCGVDVVFSFIHSVILVVILGSYLLADNTLPLDCAVFSNARTVATARIVLWCVVMAGVLYLLVFFICWSIYRRVNGPGDYTDAKDEHEMKAI